MAMPPAVDRWRTSVLASRPRARKTAASRIEAPIIAVRSDEVTMPGGGSATREVVGSKLDRPGYHLSEPGRTDGVLGGGREPHAVDDRAGQAGEALVVQPLERAEVGNEVTVEVLDVDFDRERVSLSLKATQEDPWQHFARTHAIGQVVPGKVTKLVPFGAFVRVEDGIEGLVHISELAERHVELPEQVVNVGQEIFVKVIDIDLERRRISLSLKQANEDYTEEFDPSKYGMADSYDEQGNYIFPEGFDAETNEWLDGYEKQREEWENRYAEAERRHKMHTAQMEKFAAAEARKPHDPPRRAARRAGRRSPCAGRC